MIAYTTFTMMSETELKEKCDTLFSENEDLNIRAQELMPAVLAHFKDYIDSSVNPSLPEGISVNKSDDISYSDGKFTVYTRDYQTPSGPMGGPLEIEGTVLDLFNEYKEKAPWIKEISYGFYLNH